MPRTATNVTAAPVGDAATVRVDQSLEAALADVAQCFNAPSICDKQIDAAEVLRYYRQCDRVYRRYHSRAGALHVGLVPPGTTNPIQHGHTRQAQLFGQLAAEIGAARCLEFGCGTGYNLRHLAQWYPEQQWHGVDLSTDHIRTAQQLGAGLPNAHFHVGNYLGLDYQDESFDAVLAVESLCQCDSQQQAIAEAFRLLRPEGRMMVIDCFRAGPLAQFGDHLARAAVLVEKTAAVHQFATIGPWTDMARQMGFEVASVVDHSNETTHDLARLYRMAQRFFKLSPLARSLSRRVAPRAMQNVICGLLMPYTVGQGIHRYLKVVLEKPA